MMVKQTSDLFNITSLCGRLGTDCGSVSVSVKSVAHWIFCLPEFSACWFQFEAQSVLRITGRASKDVCIWVA